VCANTWGTDKDRCYTWLRGTGKSVRMGVWTYYAPHIYTRTDCTAEAESGDLRYLRSQILPKAKVRPRDVPCWLCLVRQSTPEAARKGFSQSDFSLRSSRVGETELFHLLPNDRSPRSWSVSSEEPHPLGGGKGELGGPGERWRLSGLHSIHLPRGIQVILLHLFLSLSLSLPLSPLQFTSPSPRCTFFSPSPKLAQSPPSGFKGGQDSWVPPHSPHPPPLPWPWVLTLLFTSRAPAGNGPPAWTVLS